MKREELNMLGRIAEGIIDRVDRAVYNSAIYAWAERRSFRAEQQRAAASGQPVQQSSKSPLVADRFEATSR